MFIMIARDEYVLDGLRMMGGKHWLDASCEESLAVETAGGKVKVVVSSTLQR